MRWLTQVEPIEGELLSSYLVRCAHSNGMTPYRFTSFYFRGVPVWNRDIDRSASNNFISQVSQSSGVDVQCLMDMTMRDLASQLRLTETVQTTAAAISPWINALGIYHRIRRRYGMQYCPHCLSTAGTFKKIWRLSFVTICPVHKCVLQDCCPHCQAQVTYHRNDALLCHCHSCGLSLTKEVPEYEGSSNMVADLDRFQSRLFSFIFGGEGVVSGQILQSPNLFSGLSCLLTAIKTGVRANRAGTIVNDGRYNFVSTSRIELLRAEERKPQCLLLEGLINNWPAFMLEFANRMKLSQKDFPPTAPQWVRSVIENLPKGAIYKRKRQIPSIRRQLRALHRHKREGWRTDRARILLKWASRGL